jgi:hypothetical protein
MEPIPLLVSELEFYVFDNTYEQAWDKGYRGHQPVGRYIEDYPLLQTGKEEGLLQALRRYLDAMGLEGENSKGEWGPGQEELNLGHAPPRWRPALGLQAVNARAAPAGGRGFNGAAELRAGVRALSSFRTEVKSEHVDRSFSPLGRATARDAGRWLAVRARPGGATPHVTRRPAARSCHHELRLAPRAVRS